MNDVTQYSRLEDRMKNWSRVSELFHFQPMQNIMAVFDKMLMDRQKAIFTSVSKDDCRSFLGELNFSNSGFWTFANDIISRMSNECALYPLIPEEENLPLLDSYEKVVEYGHRKYPALHWEKDKPLNVGYYNATNPINYDVKEWDYENGSRANFISLTRAVELMWNYLHFFGGMYISSESKSMGIPFLRAQYNWLRSTEYGPWESSTGLFDGANFFAMSWPNFGSLSRNAIQAFYTPTDDLQHKYVLIAHVYYMIGSNFEDGLTTNKECNILYESDWMTGPFTSPWLYTSSTGEYQVELRFSLNVYTKFPDCYHPETLEPIWF